MHSPDAHLVSGALRSFLLQCFLGRHDAAVRISKIALCLGLGLTGRMLRLAAGPWPVRMIVSILCFGFGVFLRLRVRFKRSFRLSDFGQPLLLSTIQSGISSPRWSASRLTSSLRSAAAALSQPATSAAKACVRCATPSFAVGQGKYPRSGHPTIEAVNAKAAETVTRSRISLAEGR